MTRRGKCLRPGEHEIPFAEHAGAVVDDQSDGHRDIAGLEKRNVLQLVVFVHREGVLRQVRDRIAASVEDVDVENDEFGAGFENLRCLRILRRLLRGAEQRKRCREYRDQQNVRAWAVHRFTPSTKQGMKGAVASCIPRSVLLRY